MLLEVNATGWSLPSLFGWRSAPPRLSTLASTWSTTGFPWRIGAVASNCFALLNASAWASDQENGTSFWVRAVRGLMVVLRFGGEYGDR